MTPQPHPAVRRARAALRVAGVSGLLAVFSVLPATVAGATALESKSKPQLSIAVDDGQTSARAGDTLHYVITVKNLGAGTVSGLRVTQSLPPGLGFVSADSHGAADKTQVLWRLDLKPASTITLSTTMKVTKTPQTLLRLATVACASLSAAAPIVCATHSDQLPAGAEADAAARTSTASEPASHRAWWSAAVGVLVVAALGGGVLTRQRRKNRPPAALD